MKTPKQIREELLQAGKALQAVDELEQKYLWAHGWKYTSSTPGCYWMWEKLLKDGRTILLMQETAMKLQMDESFDDEVEVPEGISYY